jgi:hypothetical protein
MKSVSWRFYFADVQTTQLRKECQNAERHAVKEEGGDGGKGGIMRPAMELQLLQHRQMKPMRLPGCKNQAT